MALTEHEALSIKETAFQDALFNAWFATALEQTKSVFALASAGVGLALTLIYSDHIKSLKTWAPVWLFFAATAFAVSAALCIWVFRVNVRLVACIVKDQDHSREDGLVGRVDRAARIMFVAGLAFILLAAAAQIWLKD